MGNIPEYRRAPLRPSTATDGSFQADADAGNALSMAGQMVFQGGNILQRYNYAQQQVQNNNEYNDTILNYERDANELIRNHRQQYGDKPVDSTPELMKSLTELRSDTLDLTSNEDVANRIGQATARMNFSAEQSSLDWEPAQNQKVTGQKVVKQSEERITNIIRDPNANNYQNQVGAMQPVFQNLEAVFGSVIANDARREFHNKASGSYFTELINSNKISQAKQELASKNYDEHLGPDGILAVDKQISAAEQRNYNKALGLENLKFTNPYKYLNKIGETVMPLDLTNPRTVRAREALIEKYDGQLNLPFFAPNEIEGLKKGIQDMSSNEQIQYSQLMSDPDAYDSMTFHKLNDALVEQDEDFLPWVIGNQTIHDGGPKAIKTGSDIMTGLKLMGRTLENGKPAIPVPPQSEINAAFASHVQNSISNEQLYDGVKKAATAATVSILHKENKLTDSSGQAYLSPHAQKVFKKQIDNIMGETIVMRGQRARTFRGSSGAMLTNDQFHDFMDKLTTDHVLKYTGNYPTTADGKLYPIEKARGRYSIESKGHGKYFINVPVDGKMTTLRDPKTDNPFVFDLRHIEHKMHIERTRPGQFITNSDGTFSTEKSITITDPRINKGKPTNIPTIWSHKGKIKEYSKKDATEIAAQLAKKGPGFKAYDTIDQAVNAAKKRSDRGGNAADLKLWDLPEEYDPNELPGLPMLREDI